MKDNRLDYNQFWSPAFDTMRNFVFLLGEDFNLIKANRCFVKFIGKNEKELIGKKCYSLVHNSNKPPPECPHQKALKTKVFERGEFFDSNLKKWLSVDVTPIFDDKHNGIGSIHIASDVTVRKEAEDQREKVNYALREKINEIEENNQRLQDVHDELKSSESMYRALVETTDTGYVIIDNEGKVIDANPEYVRLAGRSDLNEIRGKSVIGWTADYEKEKNAEAIAKCARDGQIRNLEIDYVDKLGKIIPIEIDATVVVRDGIPQILTLCRDITEHRQVENALRERVKELNCLYSISALIEKEDSLEKMLQGVADLLPSGWLYPEVACARITVGEHKFETTNYHKTAWKQSAVIRTHGNPVVVVEICYLEKMPERDEGPFLKEERRLLTTVAERLGKVVERKHAEEALREIVKRYSALEDSSNLGVTEIDTEYNIVSVNNTLCKLFNRDAQSFIGKKCFYEFEKRKEICPHCPGRKAMQDNKSHSVETGGVRNDGTAFFVRNHAVPILKSDGTIKGFLEIVEDITERKRAQDEMKAAGDYTDNIIKSMIDALIVVDTDARIKTLNRAALEMLGYHEEELIGKPVGMILEEEEEEEEETAPFKGTMLKKLLKRGFITNLEMTWKGKTTKRIPVTLSGSAMRDRDGKLVGIVAVARDMREKKAAEDALKDSRKQYVDLVDSISDWVWEVDAKGRYTYVSPRIKDILGYAPENVIGKTPFELMPAKEARRVAEIFKQLSAEQKPIVALENINRHKDGHQVFLETSGHPFYDDDGIFHGYRGTDRDITERKKAATLLEFYREYAENIVAHLPVSLIVVNRHLRINFANQHFLSKMRLTGENIIEKELLKVLGKSIVENSALDEKIMRIIKGEAACIEDRFIIKARTYDYMIVPIKEQAGRRMNALLVMEDVTKNVIMEEQLIHSEKLSAVGTFTASVAHEINNPLSIVVGNIQYLLSNLHRMDMTKKKEIEELKETLETAKAEADRCAGIVTNLLLFSHKGHSKKTKISVNGVVNTTIKLLGHQLELSKVKTHIKLADDLPHVMGNADHLQQVFVNLILNAQHVMKEGGKLYVTTSLSDNDVTISFRDTGPGIPKKYIRKIFEPFYSTREAGKGTGLGLFIIHSIMEEHRGKIEVQSKRGQGATFILRLPVVKKNGFFN